MNLHFGWVGAVCSDSLLLWKHYSHLLFIVYFAGWGLDEEYTEPPNMEEIDQVKPVKHIVNPKKKVDDEEENQHHRRFLPWGVEHISDFEDLLGLE